MNIRYFALALCVAISSNTFAQSKKTTGKTDKAKEETPVEVSDNLVANPSFEDCNIKTLKAYGQLNELCSPWFSPNKTSADLFAEGVKGTKVVAGTNDYGKQGPMDGTC